MLDVESIQDTKSTRPSSSGRIIEEDATAERKGKKGSNEIFLFSIKCRAIRLRIGPGLLWTIIGTDVRVPYRNITVEHDSL